MIPSRRTARSGRRYAAFRIAAANPWRRASFAASSPHTGRSSEGGPRMASGASHARVHRLRTRRSLRAHSAPARAPQSYLRTRGELGELVFVPGRGAIVRQVGWWARRTTCRSRVVSNVNSGIQTFILDGGGSEWRAPHHCHWALCAAHLPPCRQHQSRARDRPTHGVGHDGASHTVTLPPGMSETSADGTDDPRGRDGERRRSRTKSEESVAHNDGGGLLIGRGWAGSNGGGYQTAGA